MIILQRRSPKRGVSCRRLNIAHFSVAPPLFDEDVTDDAESAEEFDEEPDIQAVGAGSGVVNGAQESYLFQQSGNTWGW